MLNFAFLGGIKRAEKEYEDGKALLGADWYQGNTFITNIRLGYGKILPGDIVYSNSADDIVKERLDTPKGGLAHYANFILIAPI